MRTFRQLNAVFEKIINSDMPDRVKNLKLMKLLSEIVRDYKINDKQWEECEKENPEVISLYRKISNYLNFN
ncbi:hypothetical protein [Mesobacillus harenae]|uniref:hypothetical protein n=1 Tax=Mesobacillus harenae TaxID=2213203 RepID=UPI0015802FA8|nr:hypothetical protein [Mesobacillus harenae]